MKNLLIILEFITFSNSAIAQDKPTKQETIDWIISKMKTCLKWDHKFVSNTATTVTVSSNIITTRDIHHYTEEFDFNKVTTVFNDKITG